MSGLAEKHMQYKEKRGRSSDFEILNFDTVGEHAELFQAHQSSRTSSQESPSRNAKIVVYEPPHNTVKMLTVSYSKYHKEYIEELSLSTHRLCQQLGSTFPYSVINSLAENLIHADFNEPVISILDGGKTLRFSDQGKGIVNKRAAIQAGFSTATTHHKAHIAGVGSGFPSITHYASVSGGKLSIEDNLKQGTVVTLSLTSKEEHNPSLVQENTPCSESNFEESKPLATLSLTERQQEVLVAVADCAHVGPSQMAELFEISVATAYRDLQYLEQQGYVRSVAGKRAVTEEGLNYLEGYVFGTNSYLD
jgi:predicted HTH transcriptional regulator